MWSRPTAWWWVIVAPAAAIASPAARLARSHWPAGSSRSRAARTVKYSEAPVGYRCETWQPTTARPSAPVQRAGDRVAQRLEPRPARRGLERLHERAAVEQVVAQVRARRSAGAPSPPPAPCRRTAARRLRSSAAAGPAPRADRPLVALPAEHEQAALAVAERARGGHPGAPRRRRRARPARCRCASRSRRTGARRRAPGPPARAAAARRRRRRTSARTSPRGGCPAATGRTRSATRVITPSAPSEPTTSSRSDGPAAVPGAPSVASSPAGVAQRSATTFSSIRPCPVEDWPAERVATQPPTVAHSKLWGTCASRSPCSPSARSASGSRTPGANTAVSERSSTDSSRVHPAEVERHDAREPLARGLQAADHARAAAERHHRHAVLGARRAARRRPGRGRPGARPRRARPRSRRRAGRAGRGSSCRGSAARASRHRRARARRRPPPPARARAAAGSSGARRRTSASATGVSTIAAGQPERRAGRRRRARAAAARPPARPSPRRPAPSRSDPARPSSASSSRCRVARRIIHIPSRAVPRPRCVTVSVTAVPAPSGASATSVRCSRSTRSNGVPASDCDHARRRGGSCSSTR